MNANYYIRISLLISGLILIFGCSNTNQAPRDLHLNKDTSINKDLDQWIFNHFTKNYNIDVEYNSNVYTSTNSVDIVSPKYDKVKDILNFIDNILIESLKQYSGEEFVKKYTPKKIHLFGGRNLNAYGAELPYSDNIGNILYIYNVNAFDVKDYSTLERFAREIFSGYIKYLLEIDHSILGKFSKLNFSPYNRWDISGDESKKVYNNKRNIMLQFGFFSDAAQLAEMQDIIETIATLITTKPKELNDGIKAATIVPPYTYSGEELVERTNRAKQAKKTIEGKIRVANEYMMKSFKIDLNKFNIVVLSNIKKFSNDINSNTNND